MIEFENFTEAYATYNSGIIPLEVLREQAWGIYQAKAGDAEEIAAFRESSDLTEADVVALAEDTTPYSESFGGNVFICETAEDLKHIEGCDMAFAATHGGRWPTLLDQPLDADVCIKVESTPPYIMFLLCSNNSGGNSYFIPEHLWTQNLLDSLLDLE